MKYVEIGKEVLEKEIFELQSLKNRLGEDFEKAVQMIIENQGRIILSGIGKSGHIAQKIASTLSSTGTPSFYVHPSECSHGDLGMIGKEDLLIIVSNTGNSYELKDLLNYSNRNNIPIIGFTGNSSSDLAKAASVCLDTKVEKEACPFNLAPTTSTTVCLALGDALAISVLEKRQFRKEQYAEFHPGGTLGRRLLTRVKDLMHVGDTLPLVYEDTPLKEVITKMTAKEVRGVAGVISKDQRLIGIITDGDLRRMLDRLKDPLNTPAKEIMSKNPKTINQEELAEKALFIMEEFTIQTLFVLKGDSLEPVGLLHLQDLLKAKLR